MFLTYNKIALKEKKIIRRLHVETLVVKTNIQILPSWSNFRLLMVKLFEAWSTTVYFLNAFLTPQNTAELNIPVCSRKAKTPQISLNILYKAEMSMRMNLAEWPRGRVREQQRGTCGGCFQGSTYYRRKPGAAATEQTCYQCSQDSLIIYPMGTAMAWQESRHLKEYICHIFNTAQAKSIYQVRKPSITLEWMNEQTWLMQYVSRLQFRQPEKLVISNNESIS